MELHTTTNIVFLVYFVKKIPTSYRQEGAAAAGLKRRRPSSHKHTTNSNFAVFP